MNDKIKKSLDDYLEFDSYLLYSSKYNLVRIFGGAIRDTIAQQPINDIDILVGSKSSGFIQSVLKDNGYEYIERLNSKDLQEMYSEIHVINEPHTWMKGKKIVQLIRPSTGAIGHNAESYRIGFNNLIANVDLSCCGVSWDGVNLIEDYPNAILHCQTKSFSVNERAKMYSQKRISHRIHKLIDRGWNQIVSSTSVNRELKLDLII